MINILSSAPLLIVMLVSGFFAYITGDSYFESFTTIALGFIIIRIGQSDLKNNK